MVGSELASEVDFLLRRAKDELGIARQLGPVERILAACFVRVFGVPELGLHLRTWHVLRSLRNTRGSLLDLGCGAGFLLGEIHRKYRGITLYGIEIDKQSAELAQRVHNYAKIEVGDASRIDERYESKFDAATTVDVLEHLDDETLTRFLRAANRALRPGGQLLIHVPANNQLRHLREFHLWEHHDHQREGFDATDLARRLTAAGFRVDFCKGTTGYWASLAWELNMKAALSPLHALIFPFLLLGAIGSEEVLQRSRQNNGILCSATKVR